jgi:hypothetical protein
MLVHKVLKAFKVRKVQFQDLKVPKVFKVIKDLLE